MAILREHHSKELWPIFFSLRIMTSSGGFHLPRLFLVIGSANMIRTPSNSEGQRLCLSAQLRGSDKIPLPSFQKIRLLNLCRWLRKAASFQTFSELKNWCDDEATEVVLGHTSGTKGTPGKLGGEDMANEVKHEIVESDARVQDEASLMTSSRPGLT